MFDVKRALNSKVRLLCLREIFFVPLGYVGRDFYYFIRIC